MAPDATAAREAAMEIAREIARKSPLAIAGVKQVLNVGRDQSIEAGLEYVAVWNAGMLQGDDMAASVMAQAQREQAKYADIG